MKKVYKENFYDLKRTMNEAPGNSLTDNFVRKRETESEMVASWTNLSFYERILYILNNYKLYHSLKDILLKTYKVR